MLGKEVFGSFLTVVFMDEDPVHPWELVYCQFFWMQ